MVSRGCHVTAVKFGTVELGLAGGYLHETDLGAGAYGQVTLATHF
jgi:hypothetical protein